MKWINTLLTFLKNKTEPEPEPKEDLGEAIVCFYLNEEGEVFVECQLPTDEEQGIAYGILLSKINNGAYAKNIYDIVSQVALETPEYYEIAKNVIRAWQDTNQYVDNAKGVLKDKPIVHPLHVFKQSRFRGDD